MAKDLSGKELPKGIRQKADGRYEARFTYKGKNYTLYNMELKLLKKELRDKRYEVEHDLYAKPTNIIVDNWFRTWMKEYKKNSVKYGTYKLYEDEYKGYIQKTLGKRRLVDVRNEHIQTLINGMAGKYSRKTINLVKIVLSGMFKQAYRNKLIPYNPVENTILPKENRKKEISVLSIKEQRLFLEYARKSFYYPVYIVALATGMRNGELRALQWSDIDFQGKLIYVNSTLKYIAKGEEKYRFDTPKSHSSIRSIPMLDNVCSVLKEHRKNQLESKLLLGELWEPQPGFEDLVFTGRFGKCVSEQALYQDMKRIQKQILEDGKEICPLKPHTLRHTFATRVLENGITPKVMQELLGHTSINMTLDIYSHVLPDTKAAELQKISDCF